MTIEEAIQKYGAMAVFEAGAAGECEDYAPLLTLGLDVEMMQSGSAGLPMIA